MRIAILGVGLIGGSIGLAAKRRLDAEVAGFDSDGAILSSAAGLGAIDEASASVAAACAGADVIFCSAPVAALPGLAREALAAADEDVVVTDVGSTKRELVASLAEAEGAERFVGGHPLAGAETAGVENARADLFEGARWYLTPTARSSGLLYDRLQRTIAELGARPQALDAETHDRVMATVSHLPHVVADVLAVQGADALAAGSERLPEVGPSFRDATRVAGANPPLWAEILASNSAAVAGEVDAVIERLREAVDVLRRGDRAAIEDWHRTALTARNRLVEADLGGRLCELRVRVQNRPGTVAEIALALGRGAVNIEDMALYPASDMRSGAISLWVAGQEDAERAAGIVRELGHDVTVLGSGG